MSDPAQPELFYRAFVALELSAEVRERLAGLIRLLRRADAHVAWVPAPNLHLSLAFLGAVPVGQADLIGAALDEAAAAVPPFGFEVGTLGVFGSPRAPRVIWAGVQAPEALRGLQARVAAGLRALGIPFDERPYAAHVTLGRVRSPRGREALGRLLAQHRETQAGLVGVTRVVLMRSILRPEGAEYAPLHSAWLAGARPGGVSA